MKLKQFVLSTLCLTGMLGSMLATPVLAKDIELFEDEDPITQMIEAPHDIDEEAVAHFQDVAEQAETERIEIQKNPENYLNSIGVDPLSNDVYITGQGWANIGMSRYYQTDYNDLLCPKSSSVYTIASHGCVVTSYDMIISKFGYEMNPVDVKDDLNANAPGEISGCNFGWFTVSEPGQAYSGINAVEITSTNYSTAYKNIEGAILEDHPVLVYLNNPNGGAHAMVCYGFEYYSNGDVYHYIYNPDPQNPDHQSTIEEYQADGWTVNRLMVYYE